MKKSPVKSIIKSAILFTVILFTITALTGCLTTVSSAAPPSDISLPDLEAAVFSGGIPEGFYIHEKVVEEYDNSGNRIKRITAVEKGKESLTSFIYEYDEAGLRTKRLTYNRNGNLAEYEIYDNDEYGRRIKETEFRPGGVLRNYKVYEFNDHDNSVVKRYYDPDDVIYRVIVTVYDSTGNMLEETDYRVIDR